ncbi:MAG: aminopeptidase, partial [Clostridia bacterium]|nr:aminopeptidase [Clostridia bacterium]
DPQDYIRRMERAYDVDYEAVHADCAREMERFSGVNRVVIHTGDACKLHLDFTGRAWLIDAGEGDLPCGEIYIAPVETKTNGSVFFETFYLDDEKYTDVTLRIADGEVCGSSCDAIANRFAQMPRENRIVCELGLGMNPNVTDLCGYTLLDEKMAGTFHIAVGTNDMFGGENHATDHVDFVGRAEIEIDI